MEIGKSDIVLSVAGRDQGKLFYVMETDGAYVLVANGRERRLECPRKIASGEKVLNSELRRDLAAFSQEINSQNQGRF